ncbi:MAG: biotin--[acetyl-CoA-carboxylase] ligase, partial [Acidimicrobiales bacterium]
PEGTVLLAERQTAGRGRLGRRWLDHPGGSVLCSILFRPRAELPPERWFLVPALVSLSAVEACSEAAGVECGCKWPNDLVARRDGRKVAGVLSEVSSRGAGAEAALVVGIGINCNWPGDHPPAGDPEIEEIASGATSLGLLARSPVDRDAVASVMLRGVGRRWQALVEDGPRVERALLSEYRSKCATIGRLIKVDVADELLIGRALDVDDSGRLLVDVGACVRTIDAGDVVHVR